MIGIGAIAGLVGAIAMAMYAMIAGATYQSRGYEGTSPWISELPSASWRRHS
jgi:formiminotetrahydrofolate cyclodeaminase